MRISKEEREVREKETQEIMKQWSLRFSHKSMSENKPPDLGSAENNNQDKCQNKQKNVFNNRHCT